MDKVIGTGKGIEHLVVDETFKEISYLIDTESGDTTEDSGE